MKLLTIIASCVILTITSSFASESTLTHLYDYQWSNPAAPEKALTTARIAKQLKSADVIFFGELHNHPGAHLAQMQLFAALSAHGAELSLSLEQFERDTQPFIDEYLDGKIGEEHLIDQARAWENYKSSYRPLVEFARANKLPVVAANAPKQMVVCVGRSGLDVLSRYSDEERMHVAKHIDTADGTYQQKFLAFMQQDAVHKMPDDEESRKIMQTMYLRSFAAQAVRDDTMAESIAHHLSANPGRQVLHLNGNFHSSESLGTVERLQKRAPDLNIAVIHTWSDDEEIPSSDAFGTFLLRVQALPEDFVQEKHRQQWLGGMMDKRMSSRENCP